MGDPAPHAYAAVPTVAVPVHLINAFNDEPVQSILLNCQVQIEPLGRSYSVSEEARLLDLFGERERWARTMKPLLWTNQILKVPGFLAEIAIDLLLPCTMDFEIAATKYFFGLEAGSIQVSVLFSGTVFYSGTSGALQAAQIPWDREARFHLPVGVWRQAIDAHFPDATWLRLHRDTFDRLYLFKVTRGIPSWEDALNKLLDQADASHRRADAGRIQATLEPVPESNNELRYR
jgi:hypothetical protein